MKKAGEAEDRQPERRAESGPFVQDPREAPQARAAPAGAARRGAGCPAAGSAAASLQRHFSCGAGHRHWRAHSDGQGMPAWISAVTEALHAAATSAAGDSVITRGRSNALLSAAPRSCGFPQLGAGLAGVSPASARWSKTAQGLPPEVPRKRLPHPGGGPSRRQKDDENEERRDLNHAIAGTDTAIATPRTAMSGRYVNASTRSAERPQQHHREARGGPP